MPNAHERSEREGPGNAAAGPATSTNALTSRFQQMFPVLSPAEIDRVRRFGQVRWFPAGDLLFLAGEDVRLDEKVLTRFPERSGSAGSLTRWW